MRAIKMGRSKVRLLTDDEILQEASGFDEGKLEDLWNDGAVMRMTGENGRRFSVYPNAVVREYANA